jgi:hypothetical protein
MPRRLGAWPGWRARRPSGWPAHRLRKLSGARPAGAAASRASASSAREGAARQRLCAGRGKGGWPSTHGPRGSHATAGANATRPGGAVTGRRGAPSGDRYGHQPAGGGHARDALSPAAARVVGPGFAGVGCARLSRGAVGRRLLAAGARTRTGRRGWARRGVWACLTNPASRGRAACGQTRQGPRRPQLRAHRGRALQPRRARAAEDVPPHLRQDTMGSSG